MEPTPATIAVVASVLGLALGAWFAIALRRVRETWRARAHNARGRRAEQAAAKLLAARGYRIVARQQRKTYVVREGDADRNIDLIIDFVVEKGGERLAAEVKSGGAASGLERADTRRQLLEYQLALACERVLLVDPERQQITAVEFPIPRPKPNPSAAPTRASLATAILSLVVVAIVVAVLAAGRR